MQTNYNQKLKMKYRSNKNKIGKKGASICKNIIARKPK